MKKPTGLFLCAAAASFLLLSPVPAAAAVEISDATVLESGITALGQDLGGMTVAEATQMINGYYQGIAGSTLSVTFDDKTATTTPAALGLSWDADTPVREAASYGKNGPIISRYKQQQDLKYSNVALDLSYSYDAAAVQQFVQDEIASHDTEPVNAELTRESGEFIVTDGVNGLVTDVAATTASITQLLDSDLSDHMTTAATVQVTEPEITTEMMSAVHDKLGTYNTDYSSSSSARKKNVRTAAERLNGQILMPGESLSVSDTILSRTPDNGYELAPQYSNGDSEMAYGGGVCQVSTTLYNAVIRAELQIDERHPHSMIIHYAPYSSDAAISEGNKDFIFTNNQEWPIYIAADADGSTLYFSIYGKEVRDPARTIEFVSDTLSYSDPEPKVVEDPDMAEGEERSEGSSHPDVSSTLTKVIYMNGEEVDRVQMNKDHYMGTSKTIYKGTKKKEEETTEEETTAEETEEEEEDETEESKEEKKKDKEKEKETKAPETTKAAEEELVDPPEEDFEEGEVDG
ncbi:MAG: VanW family protein [Lachnospiraceae bacterium]|nr:VanW family protein [Lachnospiraceae bacterium]